MAANGRKDISAAEQDGSNEGSAQESVNPRTNDHGPEELNVDTDKKKTRKPGSQSASSKRQNNGRGGGK
jgi:hypothetical protein